MIAFETKVDHDLDFLELSEFASQRPSVVNKARALVRDRHTHAMVGERLVEKGQLSCAEAILAEKSFLQFALVWSQTDLDISPSELADEYWHDFILNTNSYAEWCQRHFGRFMHHRPEPCASLEKRGVVQDSERLFGLYFNAKGGSSACATSINDAGIDREDHCGRATCGAHAAACATSYGNATCGAHASPSQSGVTCGAHASS